MRIPEGIDFTHPSSIINMPLDHKSEDFFISLYAYMKRQTYMITNPAESLRTKHSKALVLAYLKGTILSKASKNTVLEMDKYNFVSKIQNEEVDSLITKHFGSKCTSEIANNL